HPSALLHDHPARPGQRAAEARKRNLNERKEEIGERGSLQARLGDAGIMHEPSIYPHFRLAATAARAASTADIRDRPINRLPPESHPRIVTFLIKPASIP